MLASQVSRWGQKELPQATFKKSCIRSAELWTVADFLLRRQKKIGAWYKKMPSRPSADVANILFQTYSTVNIKMSQKMPKFSPRPQLWKCDWWRKYLRTQQKRYDFRLKWSNFNKKATCKDMKNNPKVGNYL